MIIGDIRQMSDVAHDMHDALRKVEAKRFYVEALGWPGPVFHLVTWEVLDLNLEKKPTIYQQWLAKQCVGFFGTQKMDTWWDKTRNDRCPNCGQVEEASHILHHPYFCRTKLLCDQVSDITEPLKKIYAHPDIQTSLPHYIVICNT